MVKTEQYKVDRAKLKGFAQSIRGYLKTTGGTFGVRTQDNNVIWISGGYTFGVHHTKRAEAECHFSIWLKQQCSIHGLYLHDSGIHRLVKAVPFQ